MYQAVINILCFVACVGWAMYYQSYKELHERWITDLKKLNELNKKYESLRNSYSEQFEELQSEKQQLEKLRDKFLQEIIKNRAK